MDKFLTVEVEHTNYTRLFSLDRQQSMKLSLTTLVDNQRKAEIRIFLVDERDKHLIHTYVIDSLPGTKAGEPRILLQADFDGRYALKLSFSLDGGHLGHVSISLRKYLRSRSGVSPWLIAVPALILTAAALLFLLRGFFFEQFPAPDVSRPLQASSNNAAPPEPPAAPDPPSVVEPPVVPDPPSVVEPPVVPDPPAEDTTGAETTPVPAPVDTPIGRTIYFEPDSTVLTARARLALDELGRQLKGRQNLRIELTGHCALYGTEEGRAEISRMRAENASAYLEEQGWTSGITFAVEGVGAGRPETRKREKQHLNRRVEITAVPTDSSN